MGAQKQRGAYSRVPGLRRRNAQLRWAMRGQDPLPDVTHLRKAIIKNKGRSINSCNKEGGYERKSV